VSSGFKSLTDSLPKIPSGVISDVNFGVTIVSDIFWFFFTFIWTLLLLVIAVKVKNVTVYVFVEIIFMVCIGLNITNLVKNIQDGSPKPNSGWVVVLIPQVVMALLTYAEYRKFSFDTAHMGRMPGGRRVTANSQALNGSR